MKHVMVALIALFSFGSAYASSTDLLVSGIDRYFGSGSLASYAQDAEREIIQEAVNKCTSGVKRVFDISIQFESDFAQAEDGKSEKELTANSYPQVVYTAKVECN